MAKICIIDDERDLLASIENLCKQKNHEVSVFETSSDSFLDSVLQSEPDIIFVDVNLKSDDGRNIAADLKNILPFPVQIILMSGDAGALLDYHDRYADGILNKSFTFLEFEKKLRQHLSA